jgi:hypothetical protein
VVRCWQVKQLSREWLVTWRAVSRARCSGTGAQENESVCDLDQTCVFFV